MPRGPPCRKFSAPNACRPAHKVYVILRAPGCYGPLISGQTKDPAPQIDWDRNALDAVYPFFIKKS